jgi:hypothetical protein
MVRQLFQRVGKAGTVHDSHTDTFGGGTTSVLGSSEGRPSDDSGSSEGRAEDLEAQVEALNLRLAEQQGQAPQGSSRVEGPYRRALLNHNDIPAGAAALIARALRPSLGPIHRGCPVRSRLYFRGGLRLWLQHNVFQAADAHQPTARQSHSCAICSHETWHAQNRAPSFVDPRPDDNPESNGAHHDSS